MVQSICTTLAWSLVKAMCLADTCAHDIIASLHVLLGRQLQEERRASHDHATSSAAESPQKQLTASAQAQSPQKSSAVRQADLAAQQAQAEAASLRDQVSELTGEASY